jgi:DNA-directed RNA polymerase subunit RPC12/RpoP
MVAPVKKHTIRCTQCSRQFEMIERVAQQSLARSTRCQYCGGALQVPPELAPMLDRASADESQANVPPGTPRQLAPNRPKSAFRFSAPCPSCHRRVNVAGPLGNWVATTCRSCSQRIEVRHTGESVPAGSTKPNPIEPSEVDAYFAANRGSPSRDVLIQFLHAALIARARVGDLSHNEFRRAVGLGQALEAWQVPGSFALLPMNPQESAEILGYHAFSQVGYVSTQANCATVTFVSTLDGGLNKGQLAGLVLENVVGLMSTELLGVGWVRWGGVESVQIDAKLQIVCASNRAGTLLEIVRQIGDRIEAFSSDAIAELVAGIHANRDALKARLCRSALFGRGLEGASLHQTSLPAWQERCQSFGTSMQPFMRMLADLNRIGQTTLRLPLTSGV